MEFYNYERFKNMDIFSIINLLILTMLIGTKVLAQSKFVLFAFINNHTVVNVTEIGHSLDYNNKILVNDTFTTRVCPYLKRIESKTYCKPLDSCISSRPYYMCLRREIERDYISDHIRRRGRWRDCDQLLSLWFATQNFGPGLFLDVGANIGRLYQNCNTY